MSAEPRVCEHCEASLEEKWVRCPCCGLLTHCRSCRAPIAAKWSWCPSCGTELLQPAAVRVATAGLKTDFTLSEGAALRELAQRLDEVGTPFFERIANRVPLPPWIYWIIFGELVFLGHYIVGEAVGESVLRDTSWLLGVMIGTAMALVDSGSRRLRKSALRARAIIDVDWTEYEAFAVRQARISLSNRNLALSALFFGVVNTGFGVVYGPWYESGALDLSLHALHFVIGAVCGLAVWGGLGIIRMFHEAGSLAQRLDVDADDGCCGTAFLGRKVLMDALSFFGVGLLIAAYVLASPWANAEVVLIRRLILAWALFPYAVTLPVFILPVLEIHRSISREKEEKTAQLRELRRALQSEIEQLDDVKDAALLAHRESLLGEYAEVRARGVRIAALNTWPYNIRQIAEFVTTLVIPAALFLWEQWPELLAAFVTR